MVCSVLCNDHSYFKKYLVKLPYYVKVVVIKDGFFVF